MLSREQCVAIRCKPFSSEDAYEFVGLDQVENIGFGIRKGDLPACLAVAMRHVLPIWRRCAHWTNLVLIKRFHEASYCGTYNPANKTIAIAMTMMDGTLQHPHSLRATMHHEVAHAVGDRLPDWEEAVFNVLPAISYGSEYSDSATERVARIYEYHACIADEIGGMDPVIRDFSMIYNGDVSSLIKEGIG